MVLNLHLARAAVLLIAVWLVPSLASAHAGHAHHAPAAHAMPVTTDVAHAHGLPVAEIAEQSAATTEVRSEVASATPSISDHGSSLGCKTRCCGAGDGMTCCGLALAPDVSTGPAYPASYRVPLVGAAPPLGRTPDALPEPPKPFA
jgi:hypothetical protein